MAQSPDGAYVYRATSARDNEYADAIHMYIERASAMTPDDTHEDSVSEVSGFVDRSKPLREGLR